MCLFYICFFIFLLYPVPTTFSKSIFKSSAILLLKELLLLYYFLDNLTHPLDVFFHFLHFQSAYLTLYCLFLLGFGCWCGFYFICHHFYPPYLTIKDFIASSISSILGTTAFSSSGLYGIGTSFPHILFTGASK